MERNQQNSPLLRLPTELRFMIYEFALDIGAAHVKLTHDDYPDWDRTNLCYASRQLWADVSRDYYDLKLIKLRERPPMFRTMGALETSLAKYNSG